MSLESPMLLGIDGGGTSTTALLATSVGEVLGKGRGGPSNAKAVGAEPAQRALDQAIEAAFAAAGLARVPVAVACLGLAGFDRPEDRALLSHWSESRRWADRLTLVNDGDLVLAAGTPDDAGVAIISGTGSIAVGRTGDGRTARAGGWGHLMGDEGSGYSVGLAGLRLVARRVDGREALSVLKPRSTREENARDLSDGGPLGHALCAAFGVGRPEQLVTAVYAEGMDRTRIAALAPVVVACADEDTEVRSWILEPAGYELGLAVRATMIALGWSDRVLPLAMAGSFLLSASIVREAMSDYLRRFVEPEIVSTPVEEPALGAIRLAQDALVE